MKWAKTRREAQSKMMAAVWAKRSNEEKSWIGKSIQSGYRWTKKARKAQSERCKKTLGHPWTRQHKRNFTIGVQKYLKARWAKKGERREQSERMKKQLVGWRAKGLIKYPKPSRPQISLLQRLCRVGIKGFRLEHPFGRYSLDLANPVRKLCIELDGKYWHSRNETNYRLRNRRLKQEGWKVLHIKFGRGILDSQFQKVLDFVS